MEILCLWLLLMGEEKIGFEKAGGDWFGKNCL